MDLLPGSMPSVFGECTGARMVTPLMVTLLCTEKTDKEIHQRITMSELGFWVRLQSLDPYVQ